MNDYVYCGTHEAVVQDDGWFSCSLVGLAGTDHLVAALFPDGSYIECCPEEVGREINDNREASGWEEGEDRLPPMDWQTVPVKGDSLQLPTDMLGGAGISVGDAIVIAGNNETFCIYRPDVWQEFISSIDLQDLI